MDKEKQVVRMGLPPLRIELLTGVTGLDFELAYRDRQIAVVSGVEVDFLSLEHLKANKRAIGRAKDLDDLENLPS